MTDKDFLDIIQMSIWIVIIVSGPLVLSAMIIGIIVAFAQSITQIQEMTITFVPKLVVIFFVFIFMYSFIGSEFFIFTETLYSKI